MSIYITGDTHGCGAVGRIEGMRWYSSLSSNDYIIICGDFGIPWTFSKSEELALKIIGELSCTVIFIDGNHENHDYLDSLPVEIWNNGCVHRIANNIIHLMRGQYFTIQGKTVWTFGGAVSIDKHIRTCGYDWFTQESSNFKEMDTGLENLDKHNNKVDIILTHTIPRRVMMECTSNILQCPVSDYLDSIIENVTYDSWYAGHMHIDRYFEKYRLNVLYSETLKIE